ncbi:hypothetical protein MMC25_004386 [Agyrium rufum]|nr:hypothetical protein [Agyrium rufum]
MSNSIDRFLTPRRSITPEVYTFWSSVFIPIVKSLADTQLVTGWALLLIGFAKCDVTMYHFNIISRLAMLASLTYLNALVILKEHLIGSHGGRSWRVACILSIGGLSIAANYIQYGASGNHAPATPIRCVLKEPVVQSKVTLVLVMSGWTYLYGLVVLHLYPSVEDWLKRTIRSPLESFFSRFLHLERLRSGLSEVPTFKMYCLYVWEAYQTLRKSLMMYIFASWAIVAVLCARLFHDRAYGKRIMTADDWSAQGQWGFGQVLPMLLLLLCLVFALETYYVKD